MMRVAVIGTGISGTLAARLLAAKHQVHVYEAAGHVGGHAHTVDVECYGHRYAVDVAFMVFNHTTYPNFCRMLSSLGVPSCPSDMSFSVHCQRSGLEYQGSSLGGLFAQRCNLLRPSFLRMLADILRFNRAAQAFLRSGDQRLLLGEFLEKQGFAKSFKEHYLVPMGAAIWSARPATLTAFPAHFILGFFQNHGLLQIRNRPMWRTVLGGSRNYVRALVEPFRKNI